MSIDSASFIIEASSYQRDAAENLRYPDWRSLAGEKGEIFYITCDDSLPESRSKLLPIGSTHEALLNVDPGRNRSRIGDSECEKLFGIVPAKFSKSADGASYKNFVRVAAILPNSEASFVNINVNDWLMCVNDLEVTWDNLHSILSAINSPKQIRLTLQKMLIENNKMILTRHLAVSESQMSLKSRSAADILSDDIKIEDNLTVMYLTLDSTSESRTSNDLLYHYPRDATDSNKLIVLRGMFLTLSNVMVDVSKYPANISSVKCDGRLVHIAYTQNGRELLVIAVPASCTSVSQLQALMTNIGSCLKYMFGSLESAFSDTDNTQRVNLHFKLLSQHLSAHKDKDIPKTESHYIRTDIDSFFSHLDFPVVLKLPEEAQLNVDNTLSEFEAADFGDMNEDYFDVRRAYNILGCSLFYKGYLVANHLPNEDLKDITLYTNHYNLLIGSRLAPIGGSVIWQEVFPSRKQPKVDKSSEDPFYQEISGRYFLLIVANRHSVLVVLLEAGGCAARAMGNPTADVMYVTQARQMLRQLETFDFSLICEAHLQTSKPPLTSIENLSSAPISAAASAAKGFLARAGNTASDLIKRAGAKPKPKPLETTSSPGLVIQAEGALPPDSDVHSHGSGSSPPPNDSFLHNMSRASTGSAESINSANNLYGMRSSRSRALPTNSLVGDNYSGNSTRQGGDNSDLIHPSGTSLIHNSFVLTSGEQNTLFSYLSFDSSLGVVLSPNMEDLHTQGSDLNRQLLASYFKTCRDMMSLFKQHSKTDPNKKLNETGVLLQLPNVDSKRTQPLSYWIVGRQFGMRQKENIIFVCYHSSVPESMVELAFRLTTGVRI